MTNFRTLPFELKAAGGPFDDPALLVTPSNCEQALLWDCGSLHGLKTRDLQKVRWLFLSHLHIDHLIGFDHLLRVRLFSPLPLTVYGPVGTAEVIAHRLKGYAWNLTSGSPFLIRVFELLSDTCDGLQFRCHHRFDPEPLADPLERPTPEGEVSLLPGLSVRCHRVEHGVECLAYRIDRQTPPKFSLESALDLGLQPGPWVRRLVSGSPVCQTVDGIERDQIWLAERLLSPAVSFSLGLLTDSRLDGALTERLARFFHQVDLLCCETAYLDAEQPLASENLHMTTRQAANLAALAQASELRIFHLSRRHCEAGAAQHLAEVRQVLPNSHLLSG